MPKYIRNSKEPILTRDLHLLVQIFYYSTDLFISVGLDPDEATYATTSVGGIMVVMTLVSIPLMDRAGRRTLHLLGLTGMFAMSIAFTLTFHYAEDVRSMLVLDIPMI